MRRRRFATLLGGSLFLMAGCQDNGANVDKAPLNVEEANPHGESFTIGDMQYEVSGTTDESVYIGSNEHYAKEEGILVGIDISQKNIGDSPIDVNHQGMLADSEGESYEREKGLYGGTEKQLKPDEKIRGSILFAIPMEVATDRDLFFVINDEAVHIPPTPQMTAEVEIKPEAEEIAISTGTLDEPKPDQVGAFGTYMRVDSGRMDLGTIQENSEVTVQFSQSELSWRKDKLFQVFLTDRYGNRADTIVQHNLK